MSLISTRRLPHRMCREGGYTMIEVLVATLMIALAAAGLLGAFSGARQQATYSEKQNVATAVAEQELQRITSLPWEQIALNSGATWTAKSSSATDPTSYLSAGPCPAATGTPPAPQEKPCYQYDWKTSTAVEPLVTAPAASLGAEALKVDPYTFTTLAANGTTRLSGSIYRFITWAYDKECKGTNCGGGNSAKRITVAVTVSGLKNPMVLSSLYTDPVGGKKNPLVAGAECLEGATRVQCTH